MAATPTRKQLTLASWLAKSGITKTKYVAWFYGCLVLNRSTTLSLKRINRGLVSCIANRLSLSLLSVSASRYRNSDLSCQPPGEITSFSETWQSGVSQCRVHTVYVPMSKYTQHTTSGYILQHIQTRRVFCTICLCSTTMLLFTKTSLLFPATSSYM